jgi:hypothetical protein
MGVGRWSPRLCWPGKRGQRAGGQHSNKPNHRHDSSWPVAAVLVYVPNATTSDAGIANLKPLGLATEALHLELVPPAGASSTAHASVSINSLGPIDNIQVAATGLQPGEMYRLVLNTERPDMDYA